LLIDCGNTNSVEFTMKPFLRAQGVNHLPCLVLTHGDLRCTGGAELLRALMPVDQIATSSARFRSPTYRRIIEALQKAPQHWRVLNRGDQLGSWTVLHPNPDDHFSQADDNALVLLGEFHGTRVLLLSDLGRAGQNALLERAPGLRANIVVAGLPTEGEPLNDMLLDAIKPRFVVIADSEFPATRRASPQLRQRLAQRGVQAIYTREAGSVRLSLGKGGWKLRTMAEPQPIPAVNELPRPDAS
jgi:competence protein ComEC